MAEIGKDIASAKAFLEKGQLVGIPTETVYGLAGNALDSEAAALIFETKNRPGFDPLILHTSSIERVGEFVREFPEQLRVLAENFWPGPLTLLLPRKAIVPDLVTSGLDRVAVRVPQHPLTLALLEELSFPLAAPSANPFGYISPTRPSHVEAQLGDRIPYILDGGACTVGLESTIVGMEAGEITIYRLGGLEIAELEKLVGPVTIKDHSSSNPAAPGQLDSHYSPRKPFLLGDLQELIREKKAQGENFAVLSFSQAFSDLEPGRQIALSPSENLHEAAKNLFAAMRELDESPATVILAELMPETGLGRAINDRLRRAAAK
ncbi:threonylcarbamoyl-AMP synthase [Algoriphagus sp. H41]|uniref:Threonylcarbamoyl-AMP synthase n=1 Tax=Algoriphagus oliviformis TaxID=2811231 RepID=A0ABS3C6C1_9BACT|nr:L-threonylcarbamoyladenylate synthase [Algoriphagus oliviformis]MBN7811696.1 threonylcarbamoyl-AMP synthase [Algoriphagus oliviformis]